MANGDAQQLLLSNVKCISCIKEEPVSMHHWCFSVFGYACVNVYACFYVCVFLYVFVYARIFLRVCVRLHAFAVGGW